MISYPPWPNLGKKGGEKMRIKIRKGACQAPWRIVAGIGGLFFSVAVLVGIYGFAYFDAKPEWQSDFIGLAGYCFLGALMAAYLAWACFARALRPW